MTTIDAFEASFHRHFTTDPNARVFLGLSRDLDALPDPSEQALDRQAAEAEGLLDQLRAVDDPGSFDRRLDLELAELRLSYERHHLRHTFNGRTHAAQCPRAGDEIGDGIFLMFINDPRPAADRLADITARIEQTPDYLRAMTDRLDTPVARWTKMDIEKVEGLPELFGTIRDWAAGEGWADLPRLESAIDTAKSALADYAADLRHIDTTTQLHVGADTTDEIIRLRGIDIPAADLKSIAVRFLRDTGAMIDELAGKLRAKYDLDPDLPVARVQEYLNARYRVPMPKGRLEDILDRYEEEREKILAFIRERDLFPIPEAQDMKILRTPGFMAPSIPAGAMMPPPPFREGVKTSIVYLTLSDELVDEHTDLSIPNMMIHEGIPGHHLQLASAAGHPSVIRRHADANEHAEGWTTMLEDYMLDRDYMGELTDEARFIAKRDISRIGARVLIDLFFMSGDRGYLDAGIDIGAAVESDDPFVAAGALLEEVTGFVPGRVQAELNWYSQERGYPLSYLAGNHMVWALKRDLAASDRHELSGLELDREFHRIYLESGNMPVRFLRRVFEHEGLM